uniref:Uncharacterized protein n=1 Tax=Anguilla anguilla TaxID=7936 RepID=A0A0E9WFN7_ANGAN
MITRSVPERDKVLRWLTHPAICSLEKVKVRPSKRTTSFCITHKSTGHMYSTSTHNPSLQHKAVMLCSNEWLFPKGNSWHSLVLVQY